MRKTKRKTSCKLKCFILLIAFLTVISGLNAQTAFPAGNYWSFDVGIGMSDILVDGMSLQLIIDPKLWLSPAFMIGSKMGVSYSFEDDPSDILTFEGQVYLRWNLLRLGRRENKTNIFIQGGLGLVASYRGWDNPLDDVTRTRGSVLADAALGVTIPLGERWHIEPQIRGGYPHIWGVSLTAGYKFPLSQSRVEYVETIRMLPPTEIVKVIRIASMEFILFGPDIGRYNVGIDSDAQQLNELTLNQVSELLKENSNYRVRIEGHANPLTYSTSEMEDLLTLSNMRANTVAEELRKKGVSDDQIIIIGFEGTRTATNEWDIRNRNRRVELMVIQFDDN